MIVLDLDDFKQVNDTWGHETGDLVLRGLAEALVAATRTVDLAARLGGEEFAILLPNTDAEGAQGVAERIQRELRDMAVPVGDTTRGRDGEFRDLVVPRSRCAQRSAERRRPEPLRGEARR